MAESVSSPGEVGGQYPIFKDVDSAHMAHNQVSHRHHHGIPWREKEDVLVRGAISAANKFFPKCDDDEVRPCSHERYMIMQRYSNKIDYKYDQHAAD